MSKSLNRVELIGNVGKDPDIRTMPGGDMVVNFSIATSEEWKDKATGDPKKSTEWHNLVAFGHTAKVIADFVHAGDKLRIEGRLKTEEWQTKEGEKRKTTKIYVNDVMFMGGMAEKQKRESTPRQQSLPAANANNEFNDDIPF